MASGRVRHELCVGGGACRLDVHVEGKRSAEVALVDLDIECDNVVRTLQVEPVEEVFQSLVRGHRARVVAVE